MPSRWSIRGMLAGVLTVACLVAPTRGEPSIFDDPESVGQAVKPKRPANPPTRPTFRPGTPRTPSPTPTPTPAPQPPPPPPEPDPAAVFTSVFGADAKKVESTPLGKDDVELARRLLEAAKAAIDAPKFQRLLYERTVEYAAKDKDGAGSAIALAALATLQSLYPAETTTWDDRGVAVQEKLYKTAPAAERAQAADTLRVVLMQAADRRAAAGKFADALTLARKAADAARSVGSDESAEAQDLLKAITDRQRLDRRVTELAEKLGTPEGAKDAAALAAEAIQLIAAALPARLSELPTFVNKATDPSLKYLAGVAAAPHKSLTPAQAAWAGDWFRAAAETAPVPYRPLMLRRASGWYAQFLATHLPLDAERVRILLSTQQVAGKLAKVERPDRLTSFTIVGHATSLLTTLQPDHHRVSGAWKPAIGGLSADAAMGVALMTLPVCPGESYEISLQYSAEGSAGIGLLLPMGRTSAVAVTRTGTDCSLSNVAGYVRQLGGRLPEFGKDTERHTLYVRMISRGNTVGVLVAVDGEEVGRWEGKEADLAAPADLLLPDRTSIGVFVRGGKALLMDASLHCLGSPPRLLKIPGQSDLPPDGSRPRDAVVTELSPLSVRFAHAGVVVTFDPAIPGEISITAPEPNEDIRILKAGLPRMMADATNLAPLKIEYNRYKRLLALSQEVPPFSTNADAAKLRQHFKEYQSATREDERQRAERAIFIAIHGIADRYKKTAIQWAKYMVQNLTPAEIQLAGQFGKQ